MMFDPRIRFYKLEGHEAVPMEIVDAQEGILQWASTFRLAERVVGRDVVGSVEVSTVFLGFDHSIYGDVPQIFETMIFSPDGDVVTDRYPTWEAAERGHREALDRVRAHLEPASLGGEAGNRPPPPPPPDRG